jgi:alpha-beta hydrolase superfamily lysophospholipase
MQYGGSWVEQWNKRGISVCGLDLQGCGRSEGKGGLRFFIERFEDYVADVLQLARCVHGLLQLAWHALVPCVAWQRRLR